MRVAIHQPNYLPWLGFFHKMALVDLFVLFDDVQLPRGKSYVSRTRIKGPNGLMWLTVPVMKKGLLGTISGTRIVPESNWTRKHSKSIRSAYLKAPGFEKYINTVEILYKEDWIKLLDVNLAFITRIRRMLGLGVDLIFSSTIGDTSLVGADRIMDILKTVSATSCLTGDGAGSRRYIDPLRFEREGIELVHQNFVCPKYPQQWGEFVPNLCILDLIFNCGTEAKDVLLQKGEVL